MKTQTQTQITHALTKEGKLITQGSRGDCIKWIRDNVEGRWPYSHAEDWALRHGGYKLDKLAGEDL